MLTENDLPLPRSIWLLNVRSMPLAATVNIHGSWFVTLPEDGPSFPADATVRIPFLTA